MSILLLGQGYIGSQFHKEIADRDLGGFSVKRSDIDYTKEVGLRGIIKMCQPELIVNAAAWIPQPSVDLCKDDIEKTMDANAVFPAMLSNVCWEQGIALAHISTGCFFDDQKVYTEEDRPTRSYSGYCGAYLLVKRLAESLVGLNPRSYIWRIRLPFDAYENPRNYLTKLRSHTSVWSHTNSLTHRGDFVKAALDMWAMKVPFGTYHMVNKGSISAQTILEMMGENTLGRMVPGPVTGSTLSTAKLEAAGVKVRDVREAVSESIQNWKA